jgi:hypothetical protein
VDAVGAALATFLGLLPVSCGGETSPGAGGTAGGDHHEAGAGRGGATGDNDGSGHVDAREDSQIHAGGMSGSGGLSGSGGGGAGGSGGGGAGGMEAGPDLAGGGSGTGGHAGGSGGWAGSSGASGAGGAGAAGREAGADTVPGPFPCVNPEPVVVVGTDTGYDRCASGALRRRAIVACPSAVPRSIVCAGGPGHDAGASGLQSCNRDSDCTEKPFGHCEVGNSGWYGGCRCQYGCSTDADCPSGRICVCGDAVGTCAPAQCRSDADCSGAFLCSSFEMGGADEPAVHNLICPQLGFSCQSNADMCGGNADCGGTSQMRCSSSALFTARECRHYIAQCVLGRPFLVDGAARQSAVEPRRDWALSLAPEVGGLAPRVRAALADQWAKAGLMEHASVAAFARFALQLLALGAPSDLVSATQRAMADEIQHAKMCFALASAYAGQTVGPGPLAIDGALGEVRWEQVLALVVREAMVGETTAAVEAREALAHVTDRVVFGVLERIAHDETRHAELGWRFAAWAIEQGGDAARDIVRAEIAEAKDRAERLGSADVDDAACNVDDLRAHGWQNQATRVALARATLARIVEPCARAIAGAAHPGRAGGAAPSAYRISQA